MSTQADFFSGYGEQASPTRAPARAKIDARSGGVLIANGLEAKLQERQRVHARYRRWVRQVNQETLASEPRLKGFLRYLRTVKAEQADELLDAIRESWLPDSSQPVRIFALRMIAAKADKLNRSIGNEVLDDPLPPEQNVYFLARDLLHKAGRA